MPPFVQSAERESGRGGALVTGAGRGLGREIARGLAARGHVVHVTDVDLDAAEAVAAEIGGSAFASRLDVRGEAGCRAAAELTVERAGSLAVWVNNAGVLPTGFAWEQDEEERRFAFEVNSLGTMNGTLAALEIMRPLDRGHVVNVVSLAGLVAAPGENLYAATKHASMAFTIGVQTDLQRSGSRGLKVSAICPDGIWTPMLFDKVDDPQAAASWSGVFMMPEQVAAAVMKVLDRPRPVTVIPRWRGVLIRLFDAMPALSLKLLPLVMADARRKQRRWKRRNSHNR
jgi:NAD(P)-dependent dehydrogenase (short-subunit alcohol dehydrogenase family)